MRTKYNVTKYSPRIILFIAFAIFVWLTSNALLQTGLGKQVDFDLGRNYGGMLGGIFSFLSIILIYLTLNHQTESYNRSSFENMFFQLIKYHRDNVQEWEYLVSDSSEGEKVKGQKVFIHIHRQIIKALKLLNAPFSNKTLEEIMLPEAIEILQTNKNFNDKSIDLLLLQKINIAYMIVFFGVNEEGSRILCKALQKKYKKEFYERILFKFQNIRTEWKSDVHKSPNNLQSHYFGGHQHRLGHYMRHFYQAINYVNLYEPFKKKYHLKYNYIKTYRAQLSTYEQSVFFFNSLSDLGSVWELDISNTDINNQLITKFNLIKNIPSEFINDINLAAFYPDVEYEKGEKSIRKKDLEKIYN